MSASSSRRSKSGMPQAHAALDLAALDLANTVVRASVDGGCRQSPGPSRRLCHPPGMAALDIVPVDANFKETQLKQVAIGQQVRVTIDQYPDLEIDGVVDSFAPGSGGIQPAAARQCHRKLRPRGPARSGQDR